jgi:hypothetical protein
MNNRDRGVRQCAETVVDRPTTATTSSSRPASVIVDRKVPSVSSLPVSGLASVGSWNSHPRWFSSDPRWWSTVNTVPPTARAAAPR